jgi:hypothetical protein
MADQPRLIVQLPRGGAVDRQLAAEAPRSVASGDVVIDRGPTDSRGYLEPPGAGEVVLSLPSPEALAREADEVRRVIAVRARASRPLSCWWRPPRNSATTSWRRWSTPPAAPHAP